jgi:imidazolonepropionase-like amidohydrolase
VIAFASAFRDLLAVLDRLEIPFFAGGSVASGTHGLPRQTNDIDLVADLVADQIAELCEALHAAFYADAEAIGRAIATGRSFN